ncbi:hypothetical protein AKJ16_DCAP11228 [Drosera capensis]
MVSSDSGGVAGLPDTTGVGSIVWVRRRNGSWWPGKILGSDELPVSHLMSPRSGTPVKLLGREDASVDWYKLEKSKRVKAFRCGEFDDCIERAEASLGMPAKRREKYARREDAILHALELEKQLDPKYVNLGTPGGGNGSLGNQESHECRQKLESSIENEGNFMPVSMDKGGASTELRLEHDSLEVSPQRSGLLDHGLRKPLTRQTRPSFPASNGLQKTLVEHHAFELSGNGPTLVRSNNADSTTPINKRKRTLEIPLEESIAKRRDRRRPLACVLESSGKLPDQSLLPDCDVLSLMGGEHSEHDSLVNKNRLIHLRTESNHPVNSSRVPHNPTLMPVSHPGNRHSNAFIGDLSSGSSEETQSDSSGTDSVVQDMDPEETAYSDANLNTRVRAQDRLAFRGHHESTSGEEPDISSPDGMSRYRFRYPVSSLVEVSKWQLKGKRNVRQLPRRSMARGSRGMHHLGRQRSRSKRATGPSLEYSNDSDDVACERDYIVNGIGYHEERFGNWSYLPNIQAVSTRDSFYRQQYIDRESLTLGVGPFKGYLDGGGSCFNPLYASHRKHDLLMEVELKVHTKENRREHVPWVSLMSKSNGLAIVGRPIQIEMLEDGATDCLLVTGDAPGCFRYDGNRAPMLWRTDRRTSDVGMSRPHSSRVLDDEEADDQYFDEGGTTLLSKKSAGSSPARKKSPGKKSRSYVPKPLNQLLKVAQKKVSLSGGRKIRTLSSIGISQNVGDEYYMDGVMKSFASGPPTVACIPVKLVFIRLLEAVGQPPSSLTSHVIPGNDTQEMNDPS